MTGADTENRISPGVRFHLATEFILIFAGGPLLILVLHRPGVLFILLWAGAATAWLSTRSKQSVSSEPSETRSEIRILFLRFVLLAPCIALASWFFLPETFLSLPSERPLFWAAIMVLYPLLSVWPQEMLYRQFLFMHYAPLFRRKSVLIAASALAFGFAHVIFLNPVAIIMTLAGGFMFARDYARHQLLRLTCLEHALYGCLIFTVGLGRFFYTGDAWHHH